MKRIFVLGLLLLVSFSVAFGQQKKVAWSLGYYTTWDNSYSPANIPWNAFTAVAYFQVEPNSDGTLNTPSDAVATQLIKEGHARGKKVVYCIGGEGVNTFPAACANGVRGKFISNMIAYMKRLGYDGIDTDWEQTFNDAEFTAWHKDLRDSINKLTPVPLLTVAAEDWAAITLTAAPYVDQVNDMYYSASATKYQNEIFPAMIAAKVPKAKCGAGMGISMGNSVQMDVDICNMVINNGFGGIIQWAITNGSGAPANMTAIAPFVPTTTSEVASPVAQILPEPATLNVIQIGNSGVSEIRYSIPNSFNGSTVDLGVYDLKGALVKTLTHGSGMTGAFSIPWAQTGAGKYIVKLSADSRMQAAKAIVIK